MAKRSGAVLCSKCGRLVSAAEKTCPWCGATRPGLWGYAPQLQAFYRDVFQPVPVIIGVCLLLYGLSLLLDPSAAFASRSLLNIGSPSSLSLYRLGMTGGAAWQAGFFWTLLTSLYLHGSLLHIYFNLSWVRSLGPMAVELFGPARFFLIFNGAGAAGMVASNLLGAPPTIGASGAIFGLLGAMWAFGRRRGGVWGQRISKQMWAWALPLFILGLVFPAVNNAAHLGGFVGGVALGWVLPYAERQKESRASQLGALLVGLATLVGFVLSFLKVGQML